ncbi:NAD-dependent epimerase/dehydratase family protein [Actinomadura geliboluensis]|uniref:NAD-dependent epimerase/dehydratase family protein n=1 Tax=Actinomadura geliboluensis TaxID=882440 RepID=A0A5S4H099_9ACTN|nr:NAD-dependent epimerase/dehydratase family protein [Actinomadura geliboluensis]TMR38658.1 NAD-dependent epimerase/dehydratase family protein [Actinomadura geliboluensis]
MKVMLTGATGCIGGAVVDALLARDHEVHALVRTAEKADGLARRGVRAHVGGLASRRLVLGLMRETDGLIHTAFAVGDEDGRAELDFISTAISGLSGTGKPFVYTSGLWVLGESAGAALDETAPYAPTPLVAFRPKAERLVLEGVNFGIRASIVRPGVVHGGPGGLIELLARSVDGDGHVVHVGDGTQRWPMVHRDDLADLYERVLVDAPAGSIWHGVAEPGVPVRDIAAAVATAVGCEGRVRARDVADARAELGLLADALAESQVVSGAKARELLGWRPQAPGVVEALSREDRYLRPDPEQGSPETRSV